MNFKQTIQQGIPEELPPFKPLDESVSHAPKRKDILSADEKKLALKNALRYFDKKHHEVLAREFADELEACGRIYMYRFRPEYPLQIRLDRATGISCAHDFDSFQSDIRSG